MKIIPRIKIIGIGGAGGNALSRLNFVRPKEIQTVAINTDVQDLKKTLADVKLRIGQSLTQGLGTGMNPDLGRRSAEEQRTQIEQILRGSDLVFLTAGLGGGTGSGATPVVAEISRNLGILTVAVVTQPFSFEGASRKAIAQESIKNLEGHVDSLLLVSNDRLISLVEKNLPLTKAFLLADEVLHQIVFSVLDLVLKPSLVAVGFADIRAVLKNSGRGFFGQGLGRGQNRSQEAVLKAVSSSLLEMSPEKSSRILFNVSARKLKLSEIDIVATLVTKNVLPDAKIIFGAREDESLKAEEMKVTLIATGF